MQKKGCGSFNLPLYFLQRLWYASYEVRAVQFRPFVYRIFFAMCRKFGSLFSITIPDSVTKIGGCAFAGCGSLSSITIPSSVTKLGGHAFAGCGNLTSITFEGDAPEIEYDGPGIKGRFNDVAGKGGIFEYCELEKLTVTYSGSGFEALIDEYPDINWVKK